MKFNQFFMKPYKNYNVLTVYIACNQFTNPPVEKSFHPMCVCFLPG